jgi:DNA-binding transcriptional ArsR family regulator
MNYSLYQENNKLFKALNHPIRLAIVDILRTGEACVCHMEAALGQRQAYISQQLSVLRQAGLIEDHRDGWNVYYRISNPGIFELIDLSRRLVFGDASPSFDLEPKDCPCPKCSSRKAPQPPQSVVKSKTCC